MLKPRAVVVRRPTELEELVARHGTRGQAAFFLSTRGRKIEEVDDRHQRQQSAIAAITSSLPLDWRRGEVLRADLPRFLFSPEDLVVVIGQDGLVANAAKYLSGQPVIGVNPDPERNPGVLVPFAPEVAAQILARVQILAGCLCRRGRWCKPTSMTARACWH
jgi:NAD kinase